MRSIVLATPLITFAFVAGCERLEFAEGQGGASPSTTDGTTSSVGVTSTGAGGGPRGGSANGSSVEPSADPPLAEDLNNGAGLFAEDLVLCDLPWPVVAQAPRRYRGVASAQYARFMLLGASKRLPDPGLLRVDDFLAYYADRSAPMDGRLLDAHFHETAPDTGNGEAGYVEARVRRTELTVGAPKHFVILLDVSPSMSDAMKADNQLSQEILTTLGATLKDSADEVSLITFAGDAEIVFDHEQGADISDALKNAAEQLGARAGNDLEAALKIALVVAKGPNGDDPAPVELILVTDGAAELPTAIGEIVDNARKAGVRSSVVQVAKSSQSVQNTVFHDQFLHDFANNGGGSRFFIGSAAEASLTFGSRFNEEFRTALDDVTLSVTLPAGFESVEGTTGPGTVEGASIGYGAWHSFRHNVRVTCPSTLKVTANAGEPFMLSITLMASSVTQPSTFSVPYDETFLEPSRGALLEDAVLETVEFLRSGGAQVVPLNAQRIADAGCAAPLVPECASIYELHDLMVEASKLR